MWQVRRSTVKTSRVRSLNLGGLLHHGEEPQGPLGKQGYPVRERFVQDCRVVCFEVPNGTLITRCNGRPAIHGNCKNAAHLIRLLRMCEEFLLAGAMNVYRTTDAEQLKAIKRGGYSLNDVKWMAEQLFERAHNARDRSTLPDEPDRDAISVLTALIVYAEMVNDPPRWGHYVRTLMTPEAA